jgi:hypothetical protein
LQREKFGVTDPALALEPGNEFEKGTPSYYVTRFGQPLARDTGAEPDIDRNPYNFVALAGAEPWRYEFTHPHNEFSDLSGVIEFEAEALTPCFVPEGFPVAEGDLKDAGSRWTADELRRVERRFCRMPDSAGRVRYSVPGASFKGALRTAVEAVANSRFGVMDDNLKRHAPVYRRRVFKAGVVRGPVDGSAACQVDEINLPPYGGSVTVPNSMGLLAATAVGRPASKSGNLTGRSYWIPAALVSEYREHVIKHPHYKEHWEREEQKDPAKRYYSGLTPSNWDAHLPLRKDDLVHFTLEPGGQIANFGKNVNYLWPARESLADLTQPYHPREDALFGDGRTDLAEYLFGMATPHRPPSNGHPGSEPFRGQLRFETLWGPPVDEQAAIRVELPPLTSPQSKGKSRPLYLAPGANGLSASFDDRHVEVRGRKFYWHQRPPAGMDLWPKHKFAGSALVDKEFRGLVISQCPPPLNALPAGVKFAGRIHFSNLHPVALGALLYSLCGDGGRPWAFHLGKAKPRGMGSFKITIGKILVCHVAERYRKLTKSRGWVDLKSKMPNLLAAFQDWCGVKARMPKPNKLADHPHLQDYAKLHTWPAKTAFRYYPLNFNQYSWLPGDNDSGGEPKSPARGGGSGPQFRPRGMRRARDLEP